MSLNLINPHLKFGAGGGSYTLILDETLWFGGLSFPNPTSTTQQFNGSDYTTASQTWTTKTAANTAKYLSGSCGSAGSGSGLGALFVTGSTTYAPDTRTNDLQHYKNGTWTTKANAPVAIMVNQSGGTGDGSALNSGGSSTTSGYETRVDSYDFSSNAWTGQTAMSQGRYYHSSGGSQYDNAIVICGWGNSPVTAKDNVDTYDGTTWTAQANAPSAMSHNSSGDGTPDGAMSIGGYNGASSPNVFRTYDGSTWTAQSSTPVATKTTAMGAGDQDQVIYCGGSSSNVSQTWESSGGSWVTQGNIALSTSSTSGGGNG